MDLDEIISEYGTPADLRADIGTDDEWLVISSAYLADLIEAASGVTPPVTETPAVTKVCACGCGEPVTSPRPEARYATPACRVRAHRAR